jgi:hypothetical protein
MIPKSGNRFSDKIMRQQKIFSKKEQGAMPCSSLVFIPVPDFYLF